MSLTLGAPLCWPSTREAPWSLRQPWPVPLPWVTGRAPVPACIPTGRPAPQICQVAANEPVIAPVCIASYGGSELHLLTSLPAAMPLEKCPWLEGHHLHSGTFLVKGAVGPGLPQSWPSPRAAVAAWPSGCPYELSSFSVPCRRENQRSSPRREPGSALRNNHTDPAPVGTETRRGIPSSCWAFGPPGHSRPGPSCPRLRPAADVQLVPEALAVPAPMKT